MTIVPIIVAILAWLGLNLIQTIGEAHGRKVARRWEWEKTRPSLSETFFRLRRGRTSEHARRVTMIAPFGVCNKMTVWSRMIPLADQLLLAGHAVTLIIPPWDCPHESGESYSIDDLEIVNIKLSFWRPRYADPIVLWRTWRQALATRPDVLYCFKPIGYSGAVSLLAHVVRKLMGRRGLWSFRVVLDTDDLEGLQGWAGRSKRLLGFLIDRQERLAIRCCDAVSCASRHLVEYAKSCGQSPSKVYYVPNGTSPLVWGKSSSCELESEMPLYVRRAIEQAREMVGSPLILLYSRFVEFKAERIASILRSAAREFEKLGVLVIGSGADAESIRQENGIIPSIVEAGVDPDRVIKVGWIPHQWVDDFMKCTQLAIYPVDDSMITRTKSHLRAVEVMANGLPIVANGVGDLPELLDDAAILIEPEKGSSEANFSQAVVKLLREPSLREQLGSSGRARVEQVYNWSHIFEHWARTAILGGC